ncbi:hypothetical protein O1611_g9932 [Lasiodiplodia mahajangana]|uniref:Uncharacterized protein n=1 Tax=Lasiodiplodia mahajangana TaxID=1108764 RepID=A0ACC2J3T8_9PEZI|nr:hypothetical protein O1611_g9932 [Lasiodiplodia mahajangana]
MVQLGKFKFPQGGSPKFDSSGRLSDVGPLRILDIAASLIAQGSESGSDVWHHLGPFTDATSYVLALFDCRDPPPDRFSIGVYKLLRLFIGWLSELEGYDDGQFVLTHPDLDMQNILVTEEGNICGIIDWEGVAVVPTCVGNLCYPSFLIRDWDPTVYDYDLSGATENEIENSPEELQRFRSAYCDMIGKLLGTEHPKATKMSLVIENLKIAADNPISTHGIVERVFEEMERVAEKSIGADKEELYLYEVACDLESGCLDESTVAILKNRFLHLCNSL